MKTTLRQLLFSTALACLGPLSLAVLAESTPPPVADKAVATATPASTASTTTSTAEPAAPTPAVGTSTTSQAVEMPAPAPATAESTPAAPAPAAAAESGPTAAAPQTPAPTATTSSADDKSATALRRLDQPDTNTPAAKQEKGERHGRVYHGDTGDAVVQFGSDAHLGADRSAEAVVAIFGSAVAEGTVNGAVVAIGGDTHVTGRVNDAAVAILGTNYVNNHVGDAVVAVLGNVELGPEAEVGEVVCIGGSVTRDPKAIIHGQTVNVGIFGGHLGPTFSHFEGLRAWLSRCLLLGRPLAFGEHLGWAWAIAGAFLLLYLLIALLFGRGVDRCVETLLTRPGFSILAAFLTALLVPIAILVLITTGIGIALVPFVVLGLICASLFGKTVMLATIGRPVVKLLGNGPAAHAVVGVLIGGIIVLLLYTVPFVGFAVMKLMGWIGMGVVVYTLILVSRRNKPAVAAARAVPPAGAPAFAATVPGMAGGSVATAEATVAVAPVVPASLPRAGFWIRLAGLALDVILCAILIAVANSILPHRVHIGMPGGLLLVIAAYGAIMWKLRGSTIGGIICGLKVVRIDGRDIDWATAIVRALACFLSLVVAGLGFIWVAFDDDKQSWHDKIAGTTVVCARGSVTLL